MARDKFGGRFVLRKAKRPPEGGRLLYGQKNFIITNYVGLKFSCMDKIEFSWHITTFLI